jgi:L-aspartate oxidase
LTDESAKPRASFAADSSDVLIIGSGLAGIRLALAVAPHCRVRIITKAARDEGNSRYAQGGIAAAWRETDSWQHHVEDTMVAGVGLCRREVVERTAREARERVAELIELGVEFDRCQERPDLYDLHREGGHSRRRILHAKDLTGAEIMRALMARVDEQPNIEILEENIVVDLITEGWMARHRGDIPPESDRVWGAYVLDQSSNEVQAYTARVVAVCTGGSGQVYLYSSNSGVATGDGVAMAYRAGARVANMEFVQFHPTTLHQPETKPFLISEALRGEGGTLRLANGEAFMKRYDPRLELAPRDVVARAIDAELKRTGDSCVYLDMSHMSRDAVQHHFPNIDGRCLEAGIDMAVDLIPVVPAAHYQCGGVRVDQNSESDIRNLFVVGEASCTGLHGANRLASNSLLEAVVYAHAAGRTILERLADQTPIPSVPAWDSGKSVEPDEQVVITHVWDEVQRLMWNYVGIVRTSRRLQRARKRLDLIADEIDNYYWDYQVTGDLIELRNLVNVAGLVVDCAIRRRESRGLHTTMDYPEMNPRFLRDTVLKRRW